MTAQKVWIHLRIALTLGKAEITEAGVISHFCLKCKNSSCFKSNISGAFPHCHCLIKFLSVADSRERSPVVEKITK